MVHDLDYKDIKFPVSKKHYKKIALKSNICITVFCYENSSAYPVHISKQKFKSYMNYITRI